MSTTIQAEKFAEALHLSGEALETLEGTEYETCFEVYDNDILIVPGKEDGTVFVGYMSHDDSPSDHWTDRDVGELTIFRSESDRDGFSKKVKRARKMSLVVDKFEHGNVHYSVRDTASYPDRRWDVAPCGVYVPDREMQRQYRAAVKKAEALPEGEAREAALKAAMDDVVKGANATLDEYSDWCNGEVYGITIETWKYDSESGIMTRTDDGDPCWGYMGYTATRDELAGQVARIAKPIPETPAMPVPTL